jgi:diguanylate cyclase (GGDEF)-like protein/PAS domain S-box-containing protein
MSSADARGVPVVWSQRILDAMAVPTFAVDREYRYVAYNSAHANDMRRAYGAEIELGGELLAYQTVDADRERAKEHLDRAWAGELVNVGGWAGDRSRSRRFFTVVYGPVREAGETVGVVVVAFDETAHKRIEDDLHESEQRFRALVEAVRDIVFVIDRDDRVAFVNDAAAALVHSSTADLVGRRRTDLFPADEEWSRHQAESLRTVLDTGEPLYIEYPARFPGGVRWQASSLAPLRDAEGRISGVLGIGRDITERKMAEQRRLGELEHLALADSLTGLLNRRGFGLLAPQAVAQASRAGQLVGVIYADLDDLKGINDDLGHGAGDRALRDVATVLRFTVRSADVVARIGGDEFVILAVGEDEASIHLLAERLQEGIGFFNTARDRTRPLSLSCGVALADSTAPFDVDALVVEADAAMYREKAQRRGSKAARPRSGRDTV